MSNIFVHVQSDDENNLEYFPNNTSYNFKVHLTEPLTLTGVWKIALCDIFINENSKQTNYANQLYIFCNIAGVSILSGKQQSSLMRAVSPRKKGEWIESFWQLYYIDVNKSQVFDFEIYITDRSFKLATFLKKPVSITLHFRQYPFLL
jgi:hypothetical protein